MQRQRLAPRADWQAKVEALGFDFHTPSGEPYWVEDACYHFGEHEVDVLELATQDLHALCLDLVADCVQRGDYPGFGLPPAALQLVERSWRAGERALYGRMDFSFDGRRPPKLLEYNADTPTALFEAAVVQWHWLEDVKPAADQFNSLHERLIETRMAHGTPTVGDTLHFASYPESREDEATTEYLRDTAVQAGLRTAALDIGDIGWKDGAFVDLDDRPITQLFKLYPWEWLLAEPFGVHLGKASTRWIEPPWKLLLSTKALLPALWAREPRHPNLLAAAFTPNALSGPVVRKPRLGREGAGVEILRSATEARQTHVEADVVYQEYCALPDFDAWRPVVGSWMVGDTAAGVGMREDRGPVTRNSSRFVPHYFD